MIEAKSSKYPDLPTPQEVTDMPSLRTADPATYEALNLIMAQLRNDMLPEEVQLQIVEAMTPGVRRSVVAKLAGLDASVLMTFKQQINLVDTVLRRIITPEGLLLPSGRELDISVKEAMNMSLKVVGMLTRDLPKVLTLARVQRLENALLNVVDTLPKAKQNEVLMILEKEELKAAKEGGF